MLQAQHLADLVEEGGGFGCIGRWLVLCKVWHCGIIAPGIILYDI